MYSLDSSTFRLLYQRNPLVVQRVLAVLVEQIFLSAIVIQEAIGGRLAKIASAISDKSSKSPEMAEKAYFELFETLDLIYGFQPNFIPYTREDEVAFLQLPAKIKRVGSQDCRIAVQASRRGLIVVTQNLADFQATGAACEDWSQETPTPDA